METVERSLAGTLWLEAFLLAGAAAFSDLWRAHNGRKVGRVRILVHPRKLRKILRIAIAAVAVAVLVAGAVPRPPALSVLALAMLLSFLYPSNRDSAVGEDGVRSGWHARRFGEIEEWRLIGEHLRWRLRGEWVSCVVPVEHHAELRARLDPRRESSTGDAGLDPQRISASQSQAQSDGGA